jgi:predicted MFS family arabinose efflux permease
VLALDVSRAMRRPIFWGLASVFLFTSIAMYIVMVQSVAYLVSTGLSPLRAASMMGIVGMLSLAGMVSSGWLAGRVGFAATGVVTFTVTLAGLALLVWLAHSPPGFVLAGFVALFGLSQGTRGPLVATLAAREFPGRMAGPVFGCIAAAGGVGGAFGAWVAGWLYDRTGAYETSFAVAATSLVLAALPFVLFREFRRGRAAASHPAH